MNEKVLLVIVAVKTGESVDFDFEQREMTELIDSSLGAVVGCERVSVFKPNAKFFIGQGKLELLREKVDELKPKSVVFGVDLSPIQSRNIESFLKKRVVDRTGLILDIFARRAKTKDGKLQVELAQLNYFLPRMSTLWEEQSRLGGGIGTRGPGEQQKEIEKRRLRRRIDQVKRELKKVKKHRELLRSGRRKKDFIQVALVGYTNAGKSTLLNALTGADAFAEDKLFATLDPKTRVYRDGSSRAILFTDTVGFLKDLPHGLVEAFHATLEEVVEADVIVHVMDASSPRVSEFKKVVDKVLNEIGAHNENRILALNKVDLLEGIEQSHLEQEFQGAIPVSAVQKEGLDDLIQAVRRQILVMKNS